MPTNQLRAFVEEMGHEYEALMEGAVSEETEKAQDEDTIDIGLAASNKTIQLSSSQEAFYHEESSGEEDEDEEDWVFSFVSHNL